MCQDLHHTTILAESIEWVFLQQSLNQILELRSDTNIRWELDLLCEDGVIYLLSVVGVEWR